MKSFWFLLPIMPFLSSCHLADMVNEGTAAIQANREAVEMSTQAIYDNIEAIEKSNRAIEENKRKLEEINKTLSNVQSS